MESDIIHLMTCNRIISAFHSFLNAAAKISVRPSEGMAEGGCGGNSAMPERIELSPRQLPEYLEGRTPKKNVLSFLEEIGRAQIRKARNIFFGVAERSEAVAGRPHSWGFSAKWVLTFSNKHHHFRFAEEVASALRASALVFAKKSQGVLKSTASIPAARRRFPNEVWIAPKAQEPMRDF